MPRIVEPKLLALTGRFWVVGLWIPTDGELADREGFERSIAWGLCLFSKQVQSSTLPPVRVKLPLLDGFDGRLAPPPSKGNCTMVKDIMAQLLPPLTITVN